MKFGSGGYSEDNAQRHGKGVKKKQHLAAVTHCFAAWDLEGVQCDGMVTHMYLALFLQPVMDRVPRRSPEKWEISSRMVWARRGFRDVVRSSCSAVKRASFFALAEFC